LNAAPRKEEREIYRSGTEFAEFGVFLDNPFLGVIRVSVVYSLIGPRH
jgi:hypothetical protein